MACHHHLLWSAILPVAVSCCWLQSPRIHHWSNYSQPVTIILVNKPHSITTKLPLPTEFCTLHWATETSYTHFLQNTSNHSTKVQMTLAGSTSSQNMHLLNRRYVATPQNFRQVIVSFAYFTSMFHNASAKPPARLLLANQLGGDPIPPCQTDTTVDTPRPSLGRHHAQRWHHHKH